MKTLNLLTLLLLICSHTFSQKKDFTLQEIWGSRLLLTQPFDAGNSMKDGLHFTSLEGDNKDSYILKYEYKSGKVKDTLVKSSALSFNGNPISIDNYEFSADEKKMLIASDIEMLYRWSYFANYYIYDLASKKLSPLSDGGKQMCATFSPDGSKISFIRMNNVFIKDLATGKEKQVTNDGELNKIINGKSDWVYEEEFEINCSCFWSEDSKKMSYLKFDETEVKEFSMDIYKGSLYPSEYKWKYPKAGEKNSIVTLFIYNTENEKTIPVDVGEEKDQYVPRVKWTKDPNTMSFQRMNRRQNKLELIFAEAATGKTNVVLKEENQTYIDVFYNLTFLSDKKSFIWSSEKDGYNHLYHYSNDGKQLTQITKGEWDILEFKGIDELKKTLFYTSTEEGAIESTLYSIKLDGSGKKKLSEKKGSNDALFSSGFQYYINTWSDANHTPITTLHQADGKVIRSLADNSALDKTLKDYKMSEKKFFQFKTSENIMLNAWMIKPPDFDSTKKYPVFLTIYGGPGRNTVTNEWELGQGFFWHQFLAQKGYIVVSVDNRGTQGRGEAFKKATYKQLGKLETIDQSEAAKYFGTLPYVDKSRIAIQGWSFGGYLTSLCMTKSPELFKVGIAVAPVTTWRYYDSIYTERFLQTPQENPQGYDENSPINYVKNLKGKFLLVHGTADDNVHFQNSTEMINALIKANKQFDLMIYPDRNHSIFGNNARLHLYTKMSNFIFDNL